jgi:hypothetical protein
LTNDSRPPPEPSWATVIATTLRLWIQRHVVPARRGRTGRARRYRGLAEAAAAVLVVAGALTAAVVVGKSQGETAGRTPATQSSAPADPSASSAGPANPGSSAALAAAEASRQQAAAWVAGQVDHGVIVSCDQLMCDALQQDGFPAASLSPISSSSGDPLGSGIVVATATVRSQLGPRLATVYAPLVIASFGGSGNLVQVRVTAVGGAVAYLPALRADLAARKQAGSELAGNKAIRAPAPALAQLTAGRVDSRLLITLAALTHKLGVQIVSFGDAGPGAAPGVPFRELTVTAPTAGYLSQLLGFLRAQRPPLRPDISQHQHGRTTVVQITFTAPSPTGLLGAGVSP